MFDYQEYRNKYAQHIMFYEAGVEDRQKVYNARVAVIGLGRIGIEAARLLTIAHVQLLRFVRLEGQDMEGQDSELSDVAQTQSQELLPSGLAAVHALAAAHPSIAFEVRDAPTAAAFGELLEDMDLVLYEDVLYEDVLYEDALYEEQGQRRALVSETCRARKKPWIYAEARGGSGKTVNLIPGKTACLDCVRSQASFDDKGLRYDAAVTDLIARTMAQVQATEALKILGNSPNVSAEVFCFDVDNFSHTLTVAKDDACPGCNPRAED